jgi:hypothetical protein
MPCGIPHFRLVTVAQIARAAHRHADVFLDAPRTPAHDEDAIRKQHRFFDIVGDIDDGSPLACPNVKQVFLQHQLGLRVERTKRLVHQQQRRVRQQRTRQRHPLAHPDR